MGAILITSCWTILGAIALCAHLWAASDAMRDLRSVPNDSKYWSLTFSARGNIGLSCGLAFAQLLVLVIGFAAFFLRAPDPPPLNPITPISVLISLGFVLMEATFTMVAFAIVWFRRRLRAIVRAEIARPHTAPTPLEVAPPTEASSPIEATG